MKTNIIFISIFFIALFSANYTFAQQQDSLKQKQINYYSKVLTASQDTAAQVVNIMNTYKDGVKKIVGDYTLSEATRRTKIDELIIEKNRMLVLLLSPSQQVKIIPSTERKINQTSK